ncbi:MAG: hypothetical protein ACYC1D_18660 [Acidimicrobiales bacterium]
MTEAPRSTHAALPDHVYDLVLLLQQACEDTIRYEAFRRDAVMAGDNELADWMAELAESDRRVSTKARELLRSRL